jgi:hypothetical protein
MLQLNPIAFHACRPGPPPGEFDAEEGVSFETSKGVKVRLALLNERSGSCAARPPQMPEGVQQYCSRPLSSMASV